MALIPGTNVIEQLRRQSVPATHVTPVARQSFVRRAGQNFVSNVKDLGSKILSLNRRFSLPTGNLHVQPLTFPGIGPGGSVSEAGLLGEGRGASVLGKVGSGLKSFYGKLTANPFAGAKSAKDFLKIYGTGAAGVLATEEAVRHLYSIGSGHGVGPILPGKNELAGAAYGGLNRFAALPSFLAGFFKKKGVDVGSYVIDKFNGPMSIPNVPGPMSVPGLPNINPAPINISFMQPDVGMPQAGPIGSFSPSLDVSAGGAGGMAEAALLALLLGGGAGFLLGRKRRKKYKRRKRAKKHGRRI